MNQQPGTTPPMEPIVRDTLRQLIVRYGHSLCDDPCRCEAMLRDLCGQHKREVFILVSALRQRVAADLLGGSGGLPTPLLLGRLGKRLEDELALTGEAARWAVETWALALGVIAGPVIVPTPTPTPAAAPQPANKTKPPPPPPAPATPFRDRLKDGSDGPEMVWLPPGRFFMGSADGDALAFVDEQPRHEVRIARPFAIGRFPVTFDDYDRFVVATKRPPAAKRGVLGRLFGAAEDRQRELPSDQGWGRGRRPVIEVSWEDAAAYCVWLTEQTGWTYRLPSEAQWEYACRAGTQTRWSFGDDERALGNHAWFKDNSDGKTHPVGEKQPNPWGLHDLHGNVWEWVQDHWHYHYQGAPTDGSAWEDAAGGSRVLRGGDWFDDARYCRSARRYQVGPAGLGVRLGFRLARGP
ncbi:formylglycine-generating enzyme family protein [Candidatus Thiodictyon syntrophicum]|jgi:formylglycine-generating enzyme required for sulfatase activity|nr:formylglycine-generating enzyme family protein [Candidatus Thiodictyon syntrophicum]